jgi:tetratricopeptide (TPR) repeat protein/GTP-binding protein EngB required for normal cell division
MGILDRIAGTLEGLSSDGPGAAAAKEEIALAVAFAERGDLAEAEARLDSIAARFPKLAIAFLRLGEVRARRGALEPAVTALGRAVDLDGDDPKAWLSLGDALARLRRVEPARDALRRTLALAVDPEVRGRAHARLGQVYAGAGQVGKALRELRKALELLGDDPDAALAYGRTLALAREPEASEWLTRAARRPGADVRLFIEAASATADRDTAERLLREGLDGAPDPAASPAAGALRVALARHLAGSGRAPEALELARACVEATPPGADASPEALVALREAYAADARWADALDVARREADAGREPPLDTRLALALAAGDRSVLAALAARAPRTPEEAERAGPLRAFLDGRAVDADLVTLAALAPDQAARRFVARAVAPPPPPAQNLLALLGWAHDLAARTPELMGLAVSAGRAVEAFDRALLVAVMGEFNAGKSSFVNALCGEEVAPTGVTPTTATVNVLRHGATTGARVIYHDGTSRDLGPASVGPFLRELGDAEAAAVRMVEIFHPFEALRRVEIVDTPGLNSIRAEHEKVARDFLVEADAIVWVFAAGQAAKATEREALGLARAAGKRVLGVLNKVDRASPEEVGTIVRHVEGAVGELVEAIVPLSATRALAARRAGKDDAAFTALSAALESRFFAQARALKRATALAALRRFVVEARSAGAPVPAPDFAAPRAALRALEQRLRGALARERIALRARIDETYRSAAFEVRDFVRPRAWLFGEHSAEHADEEFLIELLEDAVGRATDATRAALMAALAPSSPASTSGDLGEAPPAVRAAAGRAIDVAVDRFGAYAHGVIEGGAVAEFFRQDLPRIRLDPAAIRNALARRAPDPESALFATLARDLDAVCREGEAGLDAAEAEASIHRLLREERLDAPLYELGRAVDDLGLAHDTSERGESTGAGN